MTPITPIIEVKNLSCRMGKHYLLQNVSWQVNPGENWVVYGMNGSGKTTLLSIIAGFKHFTSGSVKLFGEEYTNENALSFRKQIGFVSSSFFDIHYSKENVLDIVLSGKSGTLSLDEELNLKDAIFAKELLQELGLGAKMNRQFDMLSKGERQNVMIARALLSRPKILIVDEPCNGLDVYHREYMLQTLADLSKEMTIIYVTHYIEEILPIFNKSLCLKRGVVFAQGDTNEVFSSDNISTLLGYPAEVLSNADGRMALRIETKSQVAQLLKG